MGVTALNSEPIFPLKTINVLRSTSKPLLIYMKEHIINNWFPDGKKNPALISSTNTSFMDKQIFVEWFREHFPFCDQRQSHIMGGRSFHTDKDYTRSALLMTIKLYNLPSHMSNVLQPLNKSSFGVAKQHYRGDVGT